MSRNYLSQTCSGSLDSSLRSARTIPANFHTDIRRKHRGQRHEATESADRGGSDGNRAPCGTISSPAHAVRVRLLAAGTLSGVRHGENCGESGRTRSSKHALWHSTGGSAQRGDSHETTSTFPFSTKPTADATR